MCVLCLCCLFGEIKIYIYIIRHFDTEPTDSICVAKKASRASVEYSKGQHVVVGIHDDGLPQFGITAVCTQSSDTWFLVVSQLTTVALVDHYQQLPSSVQLSTIV